MNPRSLAITGALFAGLAFQVPSGHAATFNLTGTIRDFCYQAISGTCTAHPDFESVLGTDPGIFQTALGAHGKPVYAGRAGNPTTHGQAAFDQWYRNTAGVNTSKSLTITLDNTITADPFVYTYRNSLADACRTD